MGKRGNSNTEERMELITWFLGLAGEGSIAHLMVDRKFVESEWSAFLNSRGIHNHIRIRENFHVIRHGKEYKAYWSFTDLCRHLSDIYYVNGQPCYLSGQKSRTMRESQSFRSLFLIVSPRNHRKCTIRDARLRLCSKDSRAAASILKTRTSEYRNVWLICFPSS